MDNILLIFGLICMFLGIIGSFLPALPGISVSWVGILLLYLTDAVENNYWVLGFTLLLAIFILIADYIIPAKSTKYFGGSKYGIWGTNIGLIIGFLSPIPFGFAFGAFFGAFLGEIYHNSQDKKRALKAATGSLLGLLASNFLKGLVSILFLIIFLIIFWQNKSNF